MSSEPMFSKKERTVIGIIIVIAIIGFSIAIVLDEPRPMKSGIITEKFRGGNNWVVTYHFVIDDDYDIEVGEDTFYDYNKGDTYSWQQ